MSGVLELSRPSRDVIPNSDICIISKSGEWSSLTALWLLNNTLPGHFFLKQRLQTGLAVILSCRYRPSFYHVLSVMVVSVRKAGQFQKKKITYLILIH